MRRGRGLAIVLLGALGSLLRPHVADARRATPEDIGYVIESYSAEVRGDPDGRTVTESKVVYRVLNPIGAERAGLQRLAFNSATQKLTLLEAYTLKGKEKIAVDPKNIETRSISASGVGFDDQKRMLVPFPQLSPGTKMVLRTRIETHTPPLKDALQSRFFVPNWVPMERFDLEMRLPRNARVELRDAHHWLKMEETNADDSDEKIFLVTGSRVPSAQTLAEDEAAPNPAEDLWIDFSTSRSWAEMSARLAGEYEEVLSEELPEKFRAIAQKLRQLPAQEAVPKLWEAFIREVRYFGDWRTVKGAYVPRPLSMIAESGFGDCKDFAALLAKGFRELGLDADVAVIERGTHASPTPKVPVLHAFNHAITVLHLGGKDYLVDGTNPIPHFGIVPNDISGRPLLVLSAKKERGALHAIPENKPEETMWSVAMNIDPAAAPSRKIAVDLKVTGVGSWELQNYLFGKTEGQTKDSVLGFLRVPEGTVDRFKFRQLKHTRTPDFESLIRVELEQSYGIRRSGPLLVFPMDPMSDLLTILNLGLKDRVSSFRLDDPTEKKWDVRIPRQAGLEPVGVPSACALKTRWFDFKRRVKETEDAWIIEDYFSNPDKRISPEELESDEFRAGQAALRKCLFKVDAVFRRKDVAQAEAETE